MASGICIPNSVKDSNPGSEPDPDPTTVFIKDLRKFQKKVNILNILNDFPGTPSLTT